MTELYRYAAFVSYSSRDAGFAKRLHRALEAYHIPKALGAFDLIGGGKQNRIYPVFRDREELPAGQLGEVIEANLRASASLIVVCSPDGAASPWVQKEIEYFAALGRANRIYAIIADKAPLFDPAGQDATTGCFPEAFRGSALAGDTLQPLAADARRGKDGFRNALLKLVAGLIGVSPGALQDRDRRRRNSQTTIIAAAAVLGAVAAVSVWRYQDDIARWLTSALQFRPYVLSQEEIAASPAGAHFKECRPQSDLCPEMVVVPEGRIRLGTDRTEQLPAVYQPLANNPPRVVEIRRLAVSRYEITNAQWLACVEASGCSPAPPSGQMRPDAPVANITWHNAVQYVAWLSEMTGQDYRLLSDDEWEYAARGRTTTTEPQSPWSFGEDPLQLGEHAWYVDNSAGTAHPVGMRQANGFGLYDMEGNVWEWVSDCGRQLYGSQPIPAAELNDEPCLFRGRRGGSWDYSAPYLNLAYRSFDPPDILAPDAGLRVARTLP